MLHKWDGSYTLYTMRPDEETRSHMIDYATMAKRFMNRPMGSPRDVVGNYEWHQEFPYESYLQHNRVPVDQWMPADIPMIISRLRVLDFGGGPGRMLERVSKC